ncbi:MAG: hypothetical protein ACRDOK_11240 [Streptosporangiaceae bacterium]
MSIKTLRHYLGSGCSNYGRRGHRDRGRRRLVPRSDRELRGTITAQAVPACGPPDAICATDRFTSERGQEILFVPRAGQIRRVSRVEPADVPPAELAIMMHCGPRDGADRTAARWRPMSPSTRWP